MDTVSDALTRIKNGYLSKKAMVVLPYSKLVLNICNLLVREGFLEGCKHEGLTINANLKYESERGSSAKMSPALTDLKRVSKPGLRVYKSRRSLPWVLNGLGIAVVSTPKGVMTDRQARKEGVGGEILAYVW